MEIKKKRSVHKKIIFIISILISSLFIALIFITIKGYSQKFFIDDNKALEAKVNSQAKKEFIEKTNPDGSTKSNGQAAPGQTSNDINISAQREPNGTVTIFTKLASISSGTCTLTITSTKTQVSKNVPVIYQDQFSSCAGFSINSKEISNLGDGNWSIKLAVSSGASNISKIINFNPGPTNND